MSPPRFRTTVDGGRSVGLHNLELTALAVAEQLASGARRVYVRPATGAQLVALITTESFTVNNTFGEPTPAPMWADQLQRLLAFTKGT